MTPPQGDDETNEGSSYVARRSIFGTTPYDIPRVHGGGNANPQQPQQQQERSSADAASRSYVRRDDEDPLIFKLQQRQKHNKTPPVPIPLPQNHIARTSSELELSEEMEIAEWRERVMFRRLVDGMRKRREAMREQQEQQEQQARKKRAIFVEQSNVVQGRMLLHHEKFELQQALAAVQDEAAATVTPSASEKMLLLPQPQPWLPPPPPLPSQSKPQDSTQEEDLLRHGRAKKQHLIDVLSRAANDDWSIEGYNEGNNSIWFDPSADSNVSKGTHFYDKPQQASSATFLPCFQPQLSHLPPPPAHHSHGKANACAAEVEDDMVFSMDL